MKKLLHAEATLLMNSISTVFFDCDGVLWDSHGLLPKSKELISNLKRLKKKVFFVTNNNLKTREGFLKKFLDHGFDVNKEEVLCSSFLAAAYVKNIVKLDDSKKVYIVGSKGIADELDSLGIKHFGCGPRPGKEGTDVYNSLNLTKDLDVGAVVVGYDQHFNMNKVCEAMQYLRNTSIPFIATNTDTCFPVTKDVASPGTGVIVQAVATASERQPVVVGKPNKMFLEIAQTTCDIDPQKSLMIGDRLNTDITFGRNCGFKTLCVLTGVTDIDKLKEVEENGDTDLIPDYFADDLTTLCNSIE